MNKYHYDGTSYLSDEQLKEKIRKGVDNNVLAYDPERTGVVTKRLVYGMWGISLDKLDRLHIPTDAFPDFDFYERQYGVLIVRDRRLNEAESRKIAREFEIAFPIKRNLLLVGVWDNGVLLGAV